MVLLSILQFHSTHPTSPPDNYLLNHASSIGLIQIPGHHLVHTESSYLCPMFTHHFLARRIREYLLLVDILRTVPVQRANLKRAQQ